jgi:hypothetical protein
MNYIVWPRPGDVVYVWFLAVFRHKGIVSDRYWNGKPMIIANSWTSGGVAEIPWDDFAGGQLVFLERAPRDLHPFVVLYNARSMMGQRYDVALSNCEHFVYTCYGLPPRSPQLATAAVLAVAAAVMILVTAQPKWLA